MHIPFKKYPKPKSMKHMLKEKRIADERERIHPPNVEYGKSESTHTYTQPR